MLQAILAVATLNARGTPDCTSEVHDLEARRQPLTASGMATELGE